MNDRVLSPLRMMVALVSVNAAACILFVPGVDSDVGQVCHFSGEAYSTCGSCVAKSCKNTLTACCADSACEETLGFLESCSVSQKQCKSLGNKAAAPSEASEDLIACITAMCETQCQTSGAATVGGKTYVTNCTQSSSSCSCSVPTSTSSVRPNTTTCGTATFDDTLCCASNDFPAPGETCQCQSIKCGSTSEGCECSTYSSGSVASCTPPSGGHCCLWRSDDRCKCGQNACSTSYEIEVSECGAAAMDCGSTAFKVNACAFYSSDAGSE